MPSQAVQDPVQRERNRQHANEVRLARFALKRRVFAGEITAAEIVLDPPDYAERMPIGHLLAAQRRWGPERVTRVVAQVPTSEMRMLGELTDRQRRVIAGLLTRP